MMANEEKMEQKQEGILFSIEDFKDGAKEYLAVKYLENKEKLMFKNKNRDKYCSYKLDKNGNLKVNVKFDKLYKDEYANRIDLCVKFKRMNFISRFMESIIIQPSRKNSKRVHIPLM